MSLIPALKKDHALMQEMDSFLSSPDQLNLWWLGQSGYLLQWNAKRVLLDPYLSDSLTHKYASTEKPHIRMSERVVDPHLLLGIDLVTSSHNHTDHLDAETLKPLLKNNPRIQMVIPEANRVFVADRLGFAHNFAIGLNDGQSVHISDITIHGIPAKHNEIDRDEHGQCKYMGYVLQLGPYSIYHSGDTLWFDGMVDVLRPFQVDLALLPINGNDPKRKVAGNLNTREAAALAKAIGARCVIPCHYDMFEFNTADVDDFVAEADRINQKNTVLRGGERYSMDQGRA